MQTTAGAKGVIRRLFTFLTTDDSRQIDLELPYTILMFALMTASGVTLYEAWKKLRTVNLLPRTCNEAKEIVRRVEVLARDPLTVMYRIAEETKSKAYREFLVGYVSAMKSGGNILSFLKSKLTSILATRSAAAKQSVETLATLVEVYTVMLVVTLCCYILFIVMFSSGILNVMGVSASIEVSPVTYFLFMFLTSLISVTLMVIAHLTRRSNLVALKRPYLIAIFPLVGVLLFVLMIMIFPQLQFIVDTLGAPTLSLVCLLIISVPPIFSYRRIAKVNFAAEEAMPSFLRDVTEARKTGLSPETCIIQASKRREYGSFSKVLQSVRNQIEWGVPLRTIFRNINEHLKSWPVLVNFFVLIESIEVGGGSAAALEILTDYSEKSRDVEKTKRNMLRPYILLSFIWSILLAFTMTTLTMIMNALNQMTVVGVTQITMAIQPAMGLFSAGVVFQCWLSGFFMGKVSDGSFAAGFRYSAMLAIAAYISLLLSQSLLGDMFSLIPT
ncbi:MAG: type II secretion system F family protein [Candidatus Bathyarchaeota archaeon]|nr:MAG: type II secretion system F family protein [Candidatus Bathyarchaeota archaeon]